MALPNYREFWDPDRGNARIKCGVLLRIVPGDQTLEIEIARAPDSSGSPGSWTSIATIGPYPRSGSIFFDQQPLDSAYWWYRVRHLGYGGTTGNWLTLVARTQARQIDEAAMAAAMLATNNFTKTPEELELGAGVRGDSTVVLGGTVKYALNRHNETIPGVDATDYTFSTSYEQVPELRVIPQTYLAPTAGNSVQFEALSPTISGYRLRAVQISSPTVTARSALFDAVQNTTPGSGSVSLGSPGSLAYCQLDHANTTATTYRVYFNVDTTSKSGGGLMRVTAYKNASAGGTVWTQVGQKTYDNGLSLTGEHIDFSAALDVNYDVRLVVSYTAGTPTVNGSVTADRVDYDEVTGGTATALTGVASASVLVQAVEKS